MSKFLILNCDDFGQSRAANAAIQHLLAERNVSSATIMPPAPGFDDAAAWVRNTGNPNIGLHLTFTSEFAGFRWSSLTGHPSLHDKSGVMHMTVEAFERNADPAAVKVEMLSQFKAVQQ